MPGGRSPSWPRWSGARERRRAGTSLSVSPRVEADAVPVRLSLALLVLSTAPRGCGITLRAQAPAQEGVALPDMSSPCSGGAAERRRRSARHGSRSGERGGAAGRGVALFAGASRWGPDDSMACADRPLYGVQGCVPGFPASGRGAGDGPGDHPRPHPPLLFLQGRVTASLTCRCCVPARGPGFLARPGPPGRETTPRRLPTARVRGGARPAGAAGGGSVATR
jgi:hypothetical protein